MLAACAAVNDMVAMHFLNIDPDVSKSYLETSKNVFMLATELEPLSKVKTWKSNESSELLALSKRVDKKTYLDNLTAKALKCTDIYRAAVASRGKK